MSIVIENYREQPLTGSVIAIFDVYLPKIQCTYRNLKLIRGKSGYFVTFPAFAHEQPDGKKTYTPYVEYSKERQAEFFRLVGDALEPFKARHHQAQNH